MNKRSVLVITAVVAIVAMTMSMGCLEDYLSFGSSEGPTELPGPIQFPIEPLPGNLTDTTNVTDSLMDLLAP